MANDQNGGGDGDEVDDALNVASNAVGAVGAIADTANANSEADVVGGAIGAAGAVAGTVGSALGTEGTEGDVREGLSVASTAASVVSGGVSTAQSLASGDVGGSASNLTSTAGSAANPTGGRRASSTVRQASSAVDTGSDLIERAEVFGSGLEGMGQTTNVEYELEIQDVDGRLTVSQMSLDEGLGELGSCSLTVVASEAHPTARELLHKRCGLTIERGDQRRHYRGIVRHARVREVHEHIEIQLQIVPAYWYLGRSIDSRVYQDKKVPELVNEIVQEFLGGMQLTVRDDTSATYEQHELLIQFQESHHAFLSRLCEMEGISYFFDHEGDKEVLVLVDSGSTLPSARSADNGRITYQTNEVSWGSQEAVTSAHHDEQVGATDAVIADYDWTRPSTDVRGEQTGRSEEQPPLEVYDHTDAQTFHRYSEPSYGANTVTLQSQMRSQLLDLARQRWHMTSTMVSAQPGHTFELSGCPDGDLDARYMIVSVSTHGAGAHYENTLECVPTSVPYRPARRTPKPIVHGVESATVVTPSGDDIQTEKHGRVKVRFHWDRIHARGDANSSAWIRVSHHWAGAGYGTFFLPRKDMEVLVTFLGGNPDRPIVTGCVYNGENAIRADLDAEKTQSYIRTRSSVEGDGYNELRFEDKQGSEFISLHAEKDLKEKVKHDHSTQVDNNQTNTVNVDQTELVKGEQKMTVKKDRTKTLEQNEIVRITGNRDEKVEGTEDVEITKKRKHTLHDDDELQVDKKRKKTVDGQETIEVKGGRETTIKSFDNLTVAEGANRNVHVTGQYNIETDGHYKVVMGGGETLFMNSASIYIEGSGRIQIRNSKTHLDIDAGGNVKLTATSFVVDAGQCGLQMKDGAVKITGPTETMLTGGSGQVTLNGEGATTNGPKVTSSASGIQEITGLLVKIN